MFSLRSFTLIAVALACFSGKVTADEKTLHEQFFQDKVQPIFAAKCTSCHGAKVQKSSYRLDVRSIALAGGDLGESPIVAGNSSKSSLIDYVSNAASDVVMPPKDSNVQRLTAEEVEVLRLWIDRGAAWPDSASAQVDDPLDWWSFKPIGKAVVPQTGSDAIDYFVKAKLAENQLTMSPPADSRTLARRLYFDLIGLPPTPEALDAFELASRSDPEGALDRLVEQLLSSSHYGERWARHWLDIVHYGDTHGYDKDQPRPNAWPYRDYVIRALNEDKPYRQFIEEQIAGDAIYANTRDGIEALGFISAGPWDFIGHVEVPESKTDGKIARHLDRDDMVSNAIGTFCSVTVHCAQCHQHKFDPITQDDYYSLQAVFAAVDRTDVKYYADNATQRRFTELEQQRVAANASLQQIETPLKQAAGEAYATLTARIEQASKANSKDANQAAEFGYHSEISATQDQTKWVQVDLGERTDLRRVTLLPCYDDFNSIGAGFGFPVRFKIEACEDPEFKTNVAVFTNQLDQRPDADFNNPGLKPFTASGMADGTTTGGNSTTISGRYVRVTATKLAPRLNDFIFALAELQVFDSADKNVAIGKPVTSLDSIEAAPRWRRTNLTDGIAPSMVTAEDKEQLVQARERLLEAQADETTKLKRRELIAQLADITESLSKLPKPNVVYAGSIHKGSGNFVGTGNNNGQPRPIFLLARGQVTQPGAEMRPGALSSLNFRPARFELPPDASESQRRVALAHWITDPANPLTWRSIVNRVWQYHFGRGFVDTPNDLGHNGGLPSHPELLDWLAADFRDSGGSLKNLHRLIVKSATYRQSSASHAEGEKLDSNNTLLWRQNRRRLEAEAIRDSVLAVSGKLDETMGGPGWQDFVVEHPEHSPHYEYGLADPEDQKTWRRSIYRFIVRSQTQPWMTSLDCADPSMRVDKRNESLSAIQALALLNNGFMLSQSKHFAERVAREAPDIESQVARAYWLALGNSPSDADHKELIEFAKTNGLPYLCRVLLNLNAFTFVD
ncbi:MAG: DUF1553 domain-containing protein [Pirellulaceae bacterium]|nr:DUF1553 domain-containing protein [Pirellulaceae bacterium]